MKEKVDNNIIKYWKENTSPDPSLHRQIYLKDKYKQFVKDNDGNKIKHSIHYANIRYKQLYKNWAKDETTISLFDDLGCIIPAFGIFLNRKPNYVKPGKKIQFAKCQYCFNFEQLWNVWKREIKNLCTCNTVVCDNFNNELNKCNDNCNDCHQCWFYNDDKINIDYRNFPIHALCCQNAHPKQKCVDNDCKECDGGDNFFNNIVNMCKSCDVSDEIFFDFFQFESKQVIRNGKKQRENMKVLYSYKYSDFIEFFKKKFKIYIKHRSDKINQEYTRSQIYKPQGNNNLLLETNDIFCSIDYIENIKTYYPDMSSSMFRDLGQISFGITWNALHIVIYLVILNMTLGCHYILLKNILKNKKYFFDQKNTKI